MRSFFILALLSAASISYAAQPPVKADIIIPSDQPGTYELHVPAARPGIYDIHLRTTRDRAHHESLDKESLSTEDRSKENDKDEEGPTVRVENHGITRDDYRETLPDELNGRKPISREEYEALLARVTAERQSRQPEHRKDTKTSRRRYPDGQHRFRLLIGDDAISVPSGFPLKTDIFHGYDFNLHDGIEFQGIHSAGRILTTSVRGAIVVALANRDLRETFAGRIVSAVDVRDADFYKHKKDATTNWDLEDLQKPLFCFYNGKLRFGGRCDILGGSENFSLKIDWLD
ncbi:hypothetical protein EX30DRAFT_396841 [Ascodesmis nigricans]|uniref:Uncharacterized protein n=1 Tax=Ascodesmis nigricans TaxID=341454 RepID=A0A4S2MTG5_9PEZI|nr:hypothetical protein EX30DRAFT_396841 [Ascodesmis nigricans]